MRWVLLVAAGIVGYQVFVPPIVGLANQSDFRRVIGKLRYGPEPPAVQYAFIALKYIPDSSYSSPDWEQFSSEDWFARLALVMNKAVSKDGKLDIRVMGFVHVLAFFGALTWLLYTTGALQARWVLWAGIVLIATDAGYVAYFNTFYTEAASYIFCLLTLAESVAICTQGVSTLRLARWSAWGVLLVFAKPVNAPLGIVLGLFLLQLAWGSWTARAGAAALFGAAVFSFATAPGELLAANTYNLVFLSVLPESRSPAADVVALGFEPGTERFSRSGAWSPDTGFSKLREGGFIGRKVTLLTVQWFYLTHPSRLWRHIRANLEIAMRLRPDLGNFAQSAGYPPGAMSKAFSFWSGFHERVLLRMARVLFLLLPVLPIGAVILRLRTEERRMHIEFLGLLGLCCLTSFMTASFGDGWETVKHLFLFNVLLDACLLAGVGYGWSAVRGYWSK